MNGHKCTILLEELGVEVTTSIRFYLNKMNELLSSLELSDTQVYEPAIRSLLKTASHFYEVVVLKLTTHLVSLGLA